MKSKRLNQAFSTFLVGIALLLLASNTLKAADQYRLATKADLSKVGTVLYYRDDAFLFGGVDQVRGTVVAVSPETVSIKHSQGVYVATFETILDERCRVKLQNIDPSTQNPEPSSSDFSTQDKWKKMGVRSLWNHNGSTVGLIVDGDQRSFIYVTVSPEMRNHVSAGTILFEGLATGGRYTGKAKRFKNGLPAISYPVDGRVTQDGQKIELTGMAPKRDGRGRVTEYVNDIMRFEFIRSI